jgi:Lrp/AsnC family transcriptional regulator, regulator for asnA, asnC and gidA
LYLKSNIESEIVERGVKSITLMKFKYDNLLNDADLKIIDILHKNSLTPFVEIARQIGISDVTVHLRVRRLKDDGIINKFTLSLNNDLVGYNHLVYIGINIRPGFTDQVIEALSTVDEVLEIHEMYGKFDLFLKVRAKDLVHIRDIIENKIGILPHILKIKLMIILKTKKEEQKVCTNMVQA